MPLPTFDLVVHATHEAGLKVGGIGAVLDGLLEWAAAEGISSLAELTGSLR